MPFRLVLNPYPSSYVSSSSSTSSSSSNSSCPSIPFSSSSSSSSSSSPSSSSSSSSISSSGFPLISSPSKYWRFGSFAKTFALLTESSSLSSGQNSSPSSRWVKFVKLSSGSKNSSSDVCFILLPLSIKYFSFFAFF